MCKLVAENKAPKPTQEQEEHANSTESLVYFPLFSLTTFPHLNAVAWKYKSNNKHI